MQNHPILPKLRELRLSGMMETLEERSELAREQSLTPTEFLALLLDDEIERRRYRKQKRMERAAGFESIKLLSQFDFGAVPTLDKSVVLEMATCSFILEKQNWLICGPTGVGKSHLAYAIGYEAIKRDMRVLSYPAHRFLMELFASRANGSYPKYMHKIITADLLILDDFGLRPVTVQGAEDLYEVIHQRYERGSIILTSNRSPSEWPELFGDSLLASAALDRLTHHARVTKITGESYRQKDRRKGASKTEAKPEITEN